MEHWKPEVARPNLATNENLRKQFLADWVLKNYAEEWESFLEEEKPYLEDDEELTIEDSDLFQEIWRALDIFNDENTAERLIKRESWSYGRAKEFEEKGLSSDARIKNNELARNWIKENNYVLPFPVGALVKMSNGAEAIIQASDKEYLEQGKVLVMTKEQEEFNQKGLGKCLGHVVRWEDLEFLA